MTEWSVLIETRAPQSVDVDEAELFDHLGELLDSLSGWGPAVGGDRRGWEARILVDAEEIADACVEAQAIVVAHATKVGLPRWTVDHVEAVSGAHLDVEAHPARHRWRPKTDRRWRGRHRRA